MKNKTTKKTNKGETYRRFYQMGYNEGVHESSRVKKFYQTNCRSCYGKGYSTQMFGLHGASDVAMGNKGFDTAPTVHVSLCDCERGKDLKKYFTIKKK